MFSFDRNFRNEVTRTELAYQSPTKFKAYGVVTCPDNGKEYRVEFQQSHFRRLSVTLYLKGNTVRENAKQALRVICATAYCVQFGYQFVATNAADEFRLTVDHKARAAKQEETGVAAPLESPISEIGDIVTAPNGMTGKVVGIDYVSNGYTMEAPTFENSHPDDDRLEFSSRHFEAGLCIWEDMLERREKSMVLDAAFERHGTFTMRHLAISVSKFACETWESMTNDEQDSLAPYDWEFIPTFMNVVRDNGFIDEMNCAFTIPLEARAMADAILSAHAAEN